MRIVGIGGGPAGLYFGISIKLRDPRHDVLVIERNRPDDTFGWGVVFSNETLDNLWKNDAESAAAIEDSFQHWDDIDVRLKGHVVRSGGHGFAGIARKRLLNILQESARARRQASVRARGRGSRNIWRRRSDRRRRRHQQPDPRSLRRGVQAARRAAPQQIHLARHRQGVRGVHLHLRGDRARLDLGACLSLRCRDLDLHRRVRGADLAGARLRPDGRR
jgi:hypothetical protein